MASGVYKIVNKVNDKVYIGSAKDLRERERGHWEGLRKGKHHSVLLQRAYEKYGPESFIFEVLSVVKKPTREKLEMQEQYWMDRLKAYSKRFGYNICRKAYSRLGMKHSEATKKKLRGPHSPELCRAIAKGVKRSFVNGRQTWNKGIPFSIGTRRKISKSIKKLYANGRQHPRPNQGRRFSKMWRRRMSEGHKQFHKDGGIVWNKGKKGVYKHSSQVRKKMSEAIKYWWSLPETRKKVVASMRRWHAFKGVVNGL